MIIEELEEKEQNENEVVESKEEEKVEASNQEEKKETEVSTSTETKEDEEEKKGRLQKRIDSLVRRANEAERMANEAVEFAKRVNAERAKERDERLVFAETTAKSQIGEADARMDFYKKKFKDAFESGDADAAADAQAKMAELAVEKSKANIFAERIKQEKQSRDSFLEKEDSSEQVEPKQSQTPRRQVSSLAVDWHKRNPWYGNDESLSAVALVENRKLLSEGYDDESPEFYEQLDKRISRFKPESKAETKTETRTVRPQTVVSGGKRTTTANAQRDLSTEQKRLIARLGISEKDYREQMQLMEKS
jgi:hypothetical protein